MIDGKLPTALAQYAREVDHIAIAVKDLDEALHWYERVLGFELLGRRTTHGARTSMHSAVLRAGPITFVLTQGTSPEDQVSRFMAVHGAGVTHVALRVQNLRAVAAEFEAAGGRFATSLLECPGLLQLFTERDPLSGMMVELIQRDGGNFTDQSVERVFRDMEASNHY